jgi:hypothetical protein
MSVLPKNSLSPKRSRSKSNDLSSHNVRTALDHSTLEILKNVSNKKNRKERNGDKKLSYTLNFDEPNVANTNVVDSS